MATNEFGLDVNYFKRLIERELGEISRQTPKDLARVFARMSVAADNSVIFEDEFQRLKPDCQD